MPCCLVLPSLSLALQEVLKKAVVRLVREKFQRDGNETPEEVGAFYDTLFVTLMEKVG